MQGARRAAMPTPRGVTPLSRRASCRAGGKLRDAECSHAGLCGAHVARRGARAGPRGGVRLRAFESGAEAHLARHAERLLFDLSDAVAASQPETVEAATAAKKGGFFGIFADVLESALKIIDGGLAAIHVPYSYGFSIILLTVLLKVATFPLSKKQVESSMALQSLQPKVKELQAKYADDQEKLQMETAKLYKVADVNPLAGCLPAFVTLPVWIGLYRGLTNAADEGLLTDGFFWIPSLSGPTSIAARQAGTGLTWLFPFENGAPPIGWHDATSYLVLPVLLVASQFASQKILSGDQVQQQQGGAGAILKFLPLMIGWFSLNVPSGLALYWFTNNLLSVAQTLLLRQGFEPPSVVEGGASMSAPQIERVSQASSPFTLESTSTPEAPPGPARGSKFWELKQKESGGAVAAKPASNGEAPVVVAEVADVVEPEVATNGSTEEDERAARFRELKKQEEGEHSKATVVEAKGAEAPKQSGQRQRGKGKQLKQKKKTALKKRK